MWRLVKEKKSRKKHEMRPSSSFLVGLISKVFHKVSSSSSTSLMEWNLVSKYFVNSFLLSWAWPPTTSLIKYQAQDCEEKWNPLIKKPKKTLSQVKDIRLSLLFLYQQTQFLVGHNSYFFHFLSCGSWAHIFNDSFVGAQDHITRKRKK